MASAFLTGNRIFQKDNASCQKVTRIVLEWFEEHKPEFQSMPCRPNSVDLSLIGHIQILIERQPRDQASSCRNISIVRDHCLDSWYNLSPVIYQELVASLPMRVRAVS
ncbi:DDE_3 domain-containing protein [Trichonephila clavipes]|nr:DDE_3 domain-containing protein [Trichonephila clavipes]